MKRTKQFYTRLPRRRGKRKPPRRPSIFTLDIESQPESMVSTAAGTLSLAAFIAAIDHVKARPYRPAPVNCAVTDNVAQRDAIAHTGAGVGLIRK